MRIRDGRHQFEHDRIEDNEARARRGSNSQLCVGDLIGLGTGGARSQCYNLIILVTTAGAHPTASGYTYGCGPHGQPFWQQCTRTAIASDAQAIPPQAGASPSGSSRPMTTIAAIDPCRADWTRVSRPQARFPGRNAA